MNHLTTLCTVAATDIAALAALAGEIFRETYTGKMPEEDLLAYVTTAFSTSQVQAEWNDPHNIFIVAFYNGELAGYAKINTRRRPERPEPAPYIEMERLYVHSRFQGKQLGAALIRHCMDYARTHQYPVLWLNVWEHNPKAIAFYRHRGFVHTDWSLFMRGNDAQKGLWMKKELS